MEKTVAPKVSIFVATLLAITKVLVGFSINSMAIVASAADSILDIVSSGINYIALKKSMDPPDEKHPYGHYKFESLATFLQSLIILISGLFILYKSIMKLIKEEAVYELNIGIYVMIFSFIATLLLVLYLNYMAKKTKSSVIEADALHYKVDLLSNGGVIAVLIIIKYTGWHFIDPIISIFIGFYIIYSAVKLGLKVSYELVDADLSDEVKDEIMDVLRQFDEYHLDAHKIRTRKAGNKKFLDMHITLCKELSLNDAHKIVDVIEKRLKSRIKDLDITIHMDPCSIKDCPGFKSCDNEKIRLLVEGEDIKNFQDKV